MQPGQIVTIYAEPISHTDPEGEAELIRKIAHSFGQEFWEVRFIDDGFTCARWIGTGGPEIAVGLGRKE